MVSLRRFKETRTVGDKKGAPIKKKFVAVFMVGSKTKVRELAVSLPSIRIALLKLICAEKKLQKPGLLVSQMQSKIMAQLVIWQLIHQQELFQVPRLRAKSPTNLSIVQDIYNIKKAKKRKMLDGRTPIEALLDHLILFNTGYQILCDQAGKTSCLFIIPKLAEYKAKNLSSKKKKRTFLLILHMKPTNTKCLSCMEQARQ